MKNTIYLACYQDGKKRNVAVPATSDGDIWPRYTVDAHKTVFGQRIHFQADDLSVLALEDKWKAELRPKFIHCVLVHHATAY